MALLLHQFFGIADQQTSIHARALAILSSGRHNPEQISFLALSLSTSKEQAGGTTASGTIAASLKRGTNWECGVERTVPLSLLFVC